MPNGLFRKVHECFSPAPLSCEYVCSPILQEVIIHLLHTKVCSESGAGFKIRFVYFSGMIGFDV